jgi:lysozyme
MTMRTSNEGIIALLIHEGVVPGPYLDSVGVHTYGVGHTAAAGSPDPKKMPSGMPSDLDAALVRVFETFRKDLKSYEAAVRRAIKVDVSQAQFDAAVSFHYNTGAIGRAAWVKKLNAGDVTGAAAAIMNWKKPPEIIERREAEQRLFRSGEYPPSIITVWQVANDGRVIWTPVRRLTAQEALGLLRGPIVHEDPESPPRPVTAKRTGIAAALAALVAAIAAAGCKIPLLNTLISSCGG